MPVLGINFGRIGFLTDAQPEQWREKLEESLTGMEPVRSCMALQWTLTRKGEQIASGCAVNDVVLSRGSLSRLVLFDVYIAGRAPWLITRRWNDHCHARGQLRLQCFRWRLAAASFNGSRSHHAHLSFP